MSRGLSGAIRSRSHIPAGDLRLHQERFSEENNTHKVKLADELHDIARAKKLSATQLAIVWNLTRFPMLTVIPGTRKTTRDKENAEAANFKLSPEELKSINGLVDGFKVKVRRYSEACLKHQNL